MSEELDTEFVAHVVDVSTGQKSQVAYLTKTQGDQMRARKAADRDILQAEQARAAKLAAMMAWVEEQFDNRNNPTPTGRK